GVDDKSAYFRKLKVEAQNEKTDAIAALVQYAKVVESLPTYETRSKKVHDVLAGVQSIPVLLNESDKTGTVGGGINELTIFSKGGQDRYFKENVEKIAPFGLTEDDVLVDRIAALGKDTPEGAELLKQRDALNAQADNMTHGQID